jgi:predicted NBD/HSP70 family sugar kinase
MATPRFDLVRWNAAAEVLAAVRRRPGVSRAAMAQELGLSSGSATEITARLRALRLLAEAPAPPQGRGRPSTVLLPHPHGPVVLAVDLRHEDWRCAVATLDGALHDRRTHRHDGRDPASVVTSIRREVGQHVRRYGSRLRAVSLAAAATIRDGRLRQASTLRWGPVDRAGLADGVPVLVGNDATLAGVAEARTGAAVGAGTALHLIVAVGIGGTLTVGGEPVAGGRGAGGEFGHLPFGDPAMACPCGAHGCWDLTVDGRALARHLGDPEPDDPRAYARVVLDRDDPAARDAVRRVAAALGSGVAGLVNAHDPDAVTLGGLAAPLRLAAPAAFADAFRAGLMRLHRDDPPAVVAATHAEDGPLHGAALVGLDHATSTAALATWENDLTHR